MSYRLMFSPGAWIAASALVLALSACPKKENPSSGDASAPGTAGAPVPLQTAEAKLQEKLNLYIGCYNRADESFQRSLERYASWVKDMDTGPTGKEGLVYGLYSVNGAEECQQAVEQAKGLPPAMPELEQAATAFAASLGPLQATINEADTYYEGKNHKDDGFAKGKALHKPLVEQANTFTIASRQFSDALDNANDVLQQAHLQRMEKEGGRNLPYFHLLSMIQAKELMRVLMQDKVDIAKASEKIDAFEKTINEMDKAPGDKPTLWGMYENNLDNFRNAAKELWRRQRDKTPYTSSEKSLLGTPGDWMVEGSPEKLLKNYNAMVEASNSLR
ncbi:MAG: YiiG family protein [Cystobacterineae bacterium]|nr:YiiG family protein [Cystobacterineae bacterium]